MAYRQTIGWSLFPTLAGALAGQQLWLLQRDAARKRAGHDYWRTCFPPDLLTWADEHLKTYTIPSDGIQLHLDVYPQPDRQAPMIVFNHGTLGYGRLFLEMVQVYYRLGYSLVLPDQRGNGFSGGARGDYTINQAVRNIRDATRWARQHLAGPLFMAGASLGGALTYYAASAETRQTPINAISCLNLFDFGDLPTLRTMSTSPHAVDLLPWLRALVPLFGWVRLPYCWFHCCEDIVRADEAKQQECWRTDPMLPHHISLRYLVSLGTTPPEVPLEYNTVPALVLNQMADTIIPPQATRHNYERLGGPKRYVPLDGFNHWSFGHTFWSRIIHETHRWFRKHGAPAPRGESQAFEGQVAEAATA
jgi:alpha-beta hydrolase superfamily lysophospholipase